MSIYPALAYILYTLLAAFLRHIPQVGPFHRFRNVGPAVNRIAQVGPFRQLSPFGILLSTEDHASTAVLRRSSYSMDNRNCQVDIVTQAVKAYGYPQNDIRRHSTQVLEQSV